MTTSSKSCAALLRGALTGRQRISLGISRHNHSLAENPFRPPLQSRPSSKAGEYSSNFFTWYSRKLDTHPVATKAISAALISGVGNVLAQYITHRQDVGGKSDDDGSKQRDNKEDEFQVDWMQVGRFASMNLIFVGPVFHYWYEFINRKLPGRSLSRVLQRLFWDEFVFTPGYVPVFLGSLWTIEGTSFGDIKNMLIDEVPRIVVAEWSLWVPVMFVNFRFVPIKFQVLVVNTVGVGWNTFLSYMAASAHKKNELAEENHSDGVSIGPETIVGEDNSHPHPFYAQTVHATTVPSVKVTTTFTGNVET